jgi:hypothetical protein
METREERQRLWTLLQKVWNVWIQRDLAEDPSAEELYDLLWEHIEQLDLLELADQVAERWGIPTNQFQEIISSISTWDPQDREIFEAAEERGGLGRLAPALARSFGLVVNDEVDERNDPAKNLESLARFIISYARATGAVAYH